MPKKRNLDHMCNYERDYWDKNVYVIGVDEVGRGCLAGPVYAGAVCFPIQTLAASLELLSLGINDSKQVSEKKRDELYTTLPELVYACSVKSVPVEHINAKGIVHSVETASCLAIQAILETLPPAANAIVFTDTHPITPRLTGTPFAQKAIKKGDQNSISIAAASIMAKVERDAYMRELSIMYPEYGWIDNKGYGTKIHRDAITTSGICQHHRTLFIRKILT